MASLSFTQFSTVPRFPFLQIFLFLELSSYYYSVVCDMFLMDNMRENSGVKMASANSPA